MLKAVFFDAGNTLLRQDAARMASLVTRLGAPATAGAVERAEHEARLPLDAWLRKANSTEAPETRRRYYTWILEKLDPAGRVDRERFFEELAREYKVRHLYAQTDPHAIPALRLLKERGLTLGVISNSDGKLATLLEAAGLSRWFDLQIDSHLVGVEKPDRRIFEIACREADVRPEEAAHIGDLPSIDPEPAAALGIAGYLLDPGDLWGHLPVKRVRTLAEYADRLTEKT